MRIGSLFSGYGGLDQAVQSVLGGDLAWYSEIEPAACTVLAAHHPGVPNLGDITAVDWAAVPPIDVLTGGYPCQPFSHAGKRQGKNDERHLWPYVCAAIDALRPGLVVLENVRGHLTLGFGDVLADLSRVGYDARWGVVRAAEAGAPHQRARIFITCRPSDISHAARGAGRSWQGRAGSQEGPSAAAGPEQPTGNPAAADADVRRRQQRDEGVGRVSVADAVSSDGPAADADGDGHGGQLHARGVGSLEGEAAGGAPERQRARREPDARSDLAAADADEHRPQVLKRGQPGVGSRADADGRGSGVEWGRYAAAIHRWERVLGRPAPSPTIPGANGRPRLSPAFVEWMMGLPAGHVTGHGLRPAQELKMLGNGVVPQQAALALRMLGVAP